MPEEIWRAKGANLAQEDITREAEKAMKSLTLDFERVDWWTAYSVGQRLAADYRVMDRVIIAGDGAHTHSSAAAQGLNTDLHDAINTS